MNSRVDETTKQKTSSTDRVRKYMKVLGLACICILINISGNTTIAQTAISPTTWGGTTPNAAAGPSAYSPVPASSVPGSAAVSVSQWNRGSGISFNAGANRYNSSQWTVGASSLSTVFANNDYIYFTVTNNANTELKITGVGVGSGQASGTGPTTFGLMYKIGSGTATPFTLVTSGGPSPSFTSTGVVLCAGQTISLYLCGWGGTGSAGTWSINNSASITASYVTAVTATASSTSPVTEPAPLNLTGVAASGITPYTYSWSGPATFSSAVASPTIDPSSSGNTGTYALTVTDNWGCTANATTAVVVNSVSCTGAPTGVTATPSATALCVGATLSLMGAATDATSYSWSGPGSFTSTDLNPAGMTAGVAASGIYTLIATNACGSATVTTSPVTVTAVPSAVTATASAATLCSGDALTLTGTATDGISYSWSGPGGYSAIDLNPAAITTSIGSAGIYSLTASNSCGGTTATTIAVAINTVPTAVTATAATTTLCSGDALTLTGAATGGVSFSWAGPDGYTSTDLNPATITTSTLSAGIYTLTATNSCGNTTATTASVTINTVPTAVIAMPSATTLCSGDALTLTVAAVGGTSYSWSGPDGYTAIGLAPAAITTTTLSAGIYTFTATNTCGNTTAFTSSITINTVPTAVTASANPATLCSGDGLTLTGAATGADSYSWSGPDGYTSTDINPAAITTSTMSAGIYTLSATNSCGTTTANTFAVTVNTVPTAVTATASATTLCSGDALTLAGSATSSIATSYGWAGPDGYTSTDLSPAAITTSTLSAGIYSLTATNVCGSTVAMTGAVVINTVPLAVTATASATTLCSGNALTLTGTGTSSITAAYSWAGPDGYTSTDLNPSAITVTTSSAGIYTLTATNACGNTLATTTIVTVNTVPTSVTATPSATPLCSGNALTLSGTAAGADTYSWSGPDGYTSTDLNPASITTSTLSAGIYTLTATNSCGNTVATTVTVVVNQVPQSVTATASPTTLCTGNLLTVNGTSSGATSYSWSGPDGYTSFSLHPSAFTTTTSSSGVYTLTATNVCGSTTATTASVTINTVPTSVTAIASPTVLCLGNTLTLTGAATSPISTSYSWAGPGGYSEAVLNPSTITATTGSAGIYTLTATNVCGNTTATTGSITVLTVPTGVTAAATVGSLCVGAAMTLTGTASGATSYGWSGPGSYSSAVLNPASMITTSASSGVYTLTATNSCGSTTATATASVDTPPAVAAIVGATTLCIGSTTSLTDVVPSGVWSSSDAGIADVSVSGIVSGITTGTATISYNVTNGCGTAMASLAITVLPILSSAPITGASTVCTSAPAIFSNANTGGTWSSDNAAIATVDAAGMVTGLSVGSAIISYTVTNGCGPTITDTLSIAVSTMPDAGIIAGPIRVCQNDTIRMADNTSGGIWLLSNNRASITDGLITGLSSGMDTAMYVVSNTCGADTALFSFYVKTVDECLTGINNVATNDVRCAVYPNPNNGSFTIKGHIGNSGSTNVDLTIANVFGQVIYHNTVALTNGDLETQVSLGENMASGMYLIHLQADGLNEAVRFTLQK